jgi:hypothetical protein
MKRPFSLKSSLLLAFAIGGCFSVSCQDNGATSVCPPLPLYETHPFLDASVADAATADSPAVHTDLARAIDAGCATAPTLFPSDGGMGGAGPTENPVVGGGASGSGSKASAAGSD